MTISVYTKKGYTLGQLCILMLVASFLIWSDTQTQNFSKIKSSFEITLVPIHYVMDKPIEWFDTFKNQFTSNKAIMTQNKHLNDQLRRALAENLRSRALLRENNELHQLLGSVSNLELKLKLAKVLRLRKDAFSQYVRVNLGRRDGVFNGQPVIDAHGVMGIVKEVNALQAKVLLITDKSMAIPITSLRSGARAIAYGQGDETGLLSLKHVPLTADFEVGDTLMTSGLGGSFFAGYPVGMIVQINTDKAKKFKTVLVKPQAKINESQYLFLIGKEADLKWQRQSSLYLGGFHESFS